MKNKQIVAMCENFYKIINFKPLEGDNITDKLVRIYQEYICNIDLNDKEAVESVLKLDSVLGKYINDYNFRKELQREIVKVRVRKDTKNVLKEIIDYIIKIFNNYEEYTTRVIYISRWI